MIALKMTLGPLNFLLLKSFSTGKVQCYKHPKFDFDTSVTSFKQIDVDTKEGIFENAAVAFSEWRRSETIINGSKNHLGASGNHPC